MDKKPHIKPYLYGMLAGFGAIALSIIFFFLIYRFDGFGSAISTLTGILMPFIYGAVIAYLLKPVCNSIESFLRRFIPEKMNGLINALSVALTILFGLLLVYALVMMIVPQLITSVTTLYYTAQANITKFMNWAKHLEFIEKNEQITELLNSAYAALNTNLDTWIKNTLLPSMQNIVSGAAIGVLNVVTMAKNLIIGIIVAVYMLASRKRFVQQGNWCDPDPETGRPATTERQIADASGREFTVRTAGTCTYATEPVPQGTGSVYGIIDYFNGKYTLRIANREVDFATVAALPTACPSSGGYSAPKPTR